jgi:RNA recognition motif-containing protein
MNIYVGNFDTQWTNENLKDLFAPFGTVDKALVMIDAFTDRSRGFGYVEMPDDAAAGQAISALDQSEQNGLKLNVSKAAVREERKGSYKVGNGGINPYRFKRN